MNLKKRTKFFILLILGLLAVAIVQTEISFSPTTYINASDITDVGFASSAGNNVSLISAHDNIPWNGTEAAGSPWTVYITFTNVSTFNYVESLMKYNSTGVAPSQHEINLSIWCVTMQSWEELEDSSLDIEYHYRATKIINTSHYISPVLNGTVVIKLTHADAGNANHRLWIDLLRLANEPQFEQTTINNYNVTGSGTGGAGCTGNCSFDGVWTNSIRKNDTLDSYGDYINLSAPFGKQSIANPLFSFITLNDGEYYEMKSLNSSSSNFSHVFGNPEHVLIEVTNGETNQFNLFQNYSTFLIGGTTYKYNSSHVDYGEANQTNINNTNITGYINITNTTGSPIPERVTLMDGNGVFLYNDNGVLRTQLSTNGIQEWKLRSGTTEVGYILYSTPADGTTNYPGVIFRNATSGERKEIEMTKTGFRFRSSGTSSQSANWVEIYNNGSVNMNYYTGAGTDYACFDANGNLTRQAGPC